MSVLIYVYASNLLELKLDALNDTLAVEGFAIVESGNAHRSVPYWSYMILSHFSTSNLRFRFFNDHNNKSNLQWIADRFPKNRNLATVRLAKNYISCQIVPGNASDKELMHGFPLFNRIIATIARKSKGVVDLAENGKLYTSVGFSRYATSLSHGETKPK
jgi:hypothetical protein